MIRKTVKPGRTAQPEKTGTKRGPTMTVTGREYSQRVHKDGKRKAPERHNGR